MSYKPWFDRVYAEVEKRKMSARAANKSSENFPIYFGEVDAGGRLASVYINKFGGFYSYTPAGDFSDSSLEKLVERINEATERNQRKVWAVTPLQAKAVGRDADIHYELLTNPSKELLSLHQHTILFKDSFNIAEYLSLAHRYDKAKFALEQYKNEHAASPEEIF